MKNIYLIAAFILFIMTSCYRDEGPILRDDIPVAPFDRIQIKADVDVSISQDNWLGVVAEGPAESLSNLEYEVRNGELTIRDVGRINRNTRIFIHIPSLRRIEHDCHSDIYGENFFNVNGKIEIVSTRKGNVDMAIIADEIEVRHRGSGNIKIEGESNFLDLKVNDSGDFNGFDLHTEDAKVKLTNDGQAEINVHYELDATITGNGNIWFTGYPNIHFDRNGNGDLIDAN